MEGTLDNEALIAQMVREAKPANIEEDMVGEVVHRGDEGQPAPMVVKEISSAGYVWVWETRTFEQLPILSYMLPQKLRERREDGSYRFTTVDPGQKEKKGTYKCLLHAEDPNREHYAEMGFRTCPAGQLRNEHQVDLHMQKRHKAEWATIKAERDKKEKAEDRALQRLLLASQIKASETPVETPQESEGFACSECKFIGKTEEGLKTHITRMHKKKK